MKMKNLFAGSVLILLAGCAATPSVHWVAEKTVDEFTDKHSCKVTVGSIYTKSSVFTYKNHYYPYIEEVNGELRVGVMSGGKFKIPVGDIQLRIDKNKAWDITMQETPPDSKPNVSPEYLASFTEGQTEEAKKVIENAYNNSMNSTARMLAPYTATTGDKAKTIVREMLSGSSVKYRMLALGQAATSTGEYALDASLQAAMAECGIQIK